MGPPWVGIMVTAIKIVETATKIVEKNCFVQAGEQGTTGIAQSKLPREAFTLYFGFRNRYRMNPDPVRYVYRE
jgi:hypothetical protein